MSGIEVSMDQLHGLTPCRNPACNRQVRRGVMYCCHECDAAHNGGYEIDKHSESCDERHARRSKSRNAHPATSNHGWPLCPVCGKDLYVHPPTSTGSCINPDCAQANSDSRVIYDLQLHSMRKG